MIDLTEYGHLNSNTALKKKGKKLDLPSRSVNLLRLSLLAALAAACGPSPSPVAPLNAPAYGTLLGNQRRALFEHEPIPTQPTVAWDTDAGSGMRGTLLLVDSVVLAATTNRQMLAFHRESGRRHWDQRFGNAVTTTVLYDNNTVYAATDERDGELIALNTARGRRQWKRGVGAVRFTPLLDQQVIYVGNDAGTVSALRTNRGEQLWRVGLGGGLAETPLDGGAHIVVFTTTDSVFSLRKSDGGLVARGALPATPSAAAALHGNTILVPTQDSTVVGLDANSLTVSWQKAVSAPVLTAPVVTQDGTAYFAARDGSLYRVREGQLERIAQLGHAIAGSLTLARGHLLLGSYDGTLLAVSLNGDVVWRHNFNDSIVAPVAVGGGAVYVPLLRGRIVKLR
ncbi:MAG TPA: PQQ-binding-like beta-propeller repeat protein [Longimicrobiales bacterium]|nr:PQQ-binding-like beta-propeller repeat protein [Longimicrobiales bacterium]